MSDRNTRNLARAYASDPSDDNAQALARAAVRMLSPTGEAELCPDCVRHQAEDPRLSYMADVRLMADHITDLRDECDDRDTLWDRIREATDGAGRVIYTHQAKQALVWSDNSDAYWEETGEAQPNWSALAFYAFQRDVVEHLGFDASEPFTCPAEDCHEAHETRAEAEDCCDDGEDDYDHPAGLAAAAARGDA
jgi:hypothetical protein